MTSKVEKVLTIGFCILWAMLIFVDYWYFHPEYKTAFQVFQYLDLSIALVVLGGVTGGSIYALRKKGKPIFFANGLGIIGLLLLISGLIIYFHFFKIGGNFTINIGEIFTYLGKLLAVIIATYSIFLTAYTVGDIFLEKIFSISFKKSERLLLKIALGVTFISLLLFCFGAFNLLDIKFILPVFLLVLGLNWKGSWEFIQTTLLQRSSNIAQLNWLGFGSLYLLLIFVALIFLQNIRPYPFGFDALVLYLNLPKLISENQGLIAGYSPYYWTLFITLGYLLFDHLEVVIALSVSGGLLSIFFIYEICRKWLNVNYSILILTIFYSLPIVNYQSYRDIKTDLGLLFVLLAAVLVVIKWLSLEDTSAYREGYIYLSDKQKTEYSTDGILGKYLSESIQLIILVGLFSGMAIGIKLTGLILIFSILSVFAFVKVENIGFLTAFVLIFAVVLIGGLEVATGLRAYHFGVDKLKFVLLAIGLIGLGYLFFYKRKDAIDLVRTATIYLVFTGLMYLPWPIKNYQETNTLSVNTFITGKPNNKVINFGEVIRHAREMESKNTPSEEDTGEIE